MVDIPPREIGMTEAVQLWAKDRQSLGACGDRQKALAGAAMTLQKQGNNDIGR